jgi:2-polyprenyl-3-methyl-5-hydroxy-6-metoxy-1,4-benzoquinol methylase
MKKLLDVGCSNGHITTGLSKIFNEAGCRVYGIDLEPPADIDGFEYLEYDAEGRIPAANDSFDFVTMFMVLHHVPEPEKLLLEIARTMAPGGYMLIRETNAHTANHVLFNEVMDQIFYQVFDHNDHLAYNTCFRDAKTWKKMFNECGLDVVKIDAPEKRNVFIPCWFLLAKPAKPSNP